MGILDDLKMGLGFKEKDRDYYDRTEKTLRRTQGDNRADQYREYLGKGSGPFATVTSKSNPRYGQQARDQSGNPYRTHAGRYADAPNYSSPIGPNVSDFRQGSRPSNAPTPGTFGHSMGKIPGMMGLLARFLNGSGNNLPEQPLMSNAQRQARPQRRGAPQGAPTASTGAGYTPPQVDATQLDDPGAVIRKRISYMPMTSVNPLNFTNTEAAQNYTSQPDSAFAGVPPSQRPGAVTGTVSDMGPLMDDLPLGPQSFFGGAIDAPAAGFATADGGVFPGDAEFEEAAYQQWLTSPQGERYSDPDLPDDFRRRMYDSWLRLKAGKF
tara:strand:+ start:293 stop:1264 length:972 start_codon:yes stop_codon:yes gene_type:complete